MKGPEASGRSRNWGWAGGRNGRHGLPLRRSLAAAALLSLCLACSDDEGYTLVAEGRYVELWQSTALEGQVCPSNAAAIDRRIKELAATLRVSIPDDYLLLAYIEPNDPAVKEACENENVGACFRWRTDGVPITFSPARPRDHETVHAVQQFRGTSTPHVALREGEAMMFEASEDRVIVTDFCLPQPLDDAIILAALQDRNEVGAYSVYHEFVARVYQDLGPEAFDQLWNASAQDPSTAGLLAAFEQVAGTSLYEFMARPSHTCRDRYPVCTGLEEHVLTEDGLTLDVPSECETDVTGTAGNEVFRSFVLELPQAGDVSVIFDGGFGLASLGSCSGFDADHGYYGFSSAISPPETRFFEAGLYRAFVMGDETSGSAQAHFSFEPASP